MKEKYVCLAGDFVNYEHKMRMELIWIYTVGYLKDKTKKV